MKVYGHPMSSTTSKVRIVFAEKGQPYEFVQVELAKGEHKSSDFLGRNPWGKVPVLDDDGFVLYESRAIIRYLDATLPGPKLTPEGPRGAAVMEQWISVEQSYVSPHAGVLVSQKILGPMRGQAPDEAKVEHARGGLRTALAVLDAQLAKTPFVAGEQFSLADVVLMPYVGVLAVAHEGELVSGQKHLSAWWQRVSSRPSWRALHEAR